jgi:hypothetical protein
VLLGSPHPGSRSAPGSIYLFDAEKILNAPVIVAGANRDDFGVRAGNISAAHQSFGSAQARNLRRPVPTSTVFGNAFGMSAP